MKNKFVSLENLVGIVDNVSLSEKYVKYICGLDNDRQYKHQEILDIKSLLTNLRISSEDKKDFIYGYIVPQLNKEFDLLKITENSCVNIELKRQSVGLEKIERQLLQNQHFLKMLNKQNMFLFTYIAENGKLYKLENDRILEHDLDILRKTLQGLEAVEIDLDEVFTPKNILVSPLNSPEKFLLNNYLLTENQINIKNAIIRYITTIVSERFVGITGGPGTGKTLLLYDIAKYLGQNNNVLIVHSGILCGGHRYLNEKLENVCIIAARDLKTQPTENIDIIIVDEAHRLYKGAFDEIQLWAKKNKKVAIFSYDTNQKLSSSENYRDIPQKIESICGEYVYKLTNKIRTNKELALFITCLSDLSKFRQEYRFNNIDIYFEPNEQTAVYLAKKLEENDNFTYISYTASSYNCDLNYQVSDNNTHKVIGQEFDNVCMILDKYFYYDGDLLKGKKHPNPDYIIEKLLYQGLTRVRRKLAIIITREDILEKVLSMFV